MRCAALSKAQLYRAHLTTYTVFHYALEHLSRSCKIFVSKYVHSTGLCACANVFTVSKSDSLGYRNKNGGMIFKSVFNVVYKSLFVEDTLGKIYKVGALAVKRCECRRSGKPSRISAHDLNDSHSIHSIYVYITYDLCDGSSHKLCGTAKSGRMIGSHKIVVYSLRNTYYTKLIIVRCRISRKLENGIHRIVAADIEEVSDIILFEDLEYSVICRSIILV